MKSSAPGGIFVCFSEKQILQKRILRAVVPSCYETYANESVC